MKTNKYQEKKKAYRIVKRQLNKSTNNFYTALNNKNLNDIIAAKNELHDTLNHFEIIIKYITYLMKQESKKAQTTSIKSKHI